MKKTLEVLNSLVKERVIEDYAIGGAVAAIFYTEPSETADLDVFITFPSDQMLVSLDVIYAHLREKGFATFEQEGIVIEGIPVQFLPAATPLLLDAFRNAREESVAGAPCRIMRFEHLAAIMLDTGRPKDKLRLVQSWESPLLDREKFQDICSNHGLQRKWEDFHAKYIDSPEN
ncbi:MAG: hypothetical protein ACOYNN_14680 [Terrimicrobiaceae bacterium]